MNDKTQDLISQLEQGIEAARSSETFRRYLETAAKFHKYSLGNQILIAMQAPNASRVAGFHKWLELGRAVRKGEHGIRILAPITYAKKDDEAEDGERIAIFFKGVSVFDVAQTDGEDLPEIAPLLEDDENECGAMVLLVNLQGVVSAQGLAFDRTPDRAPEGCHGFYSRAGREIWLAPNGVTQSAKTLAHELAHHFAGDEGECRADKELIAEAAAFIVCAHYGIDSGSYSFDYLASWSQADAKEFKAHLTTIQRTAKAIIDGLEAVGLVAA